MALWQWQRDYLSLYEHAPTEESYDTRDRPKSDICEYNSQPVMVEDMFVGWNGIRKLYALPRFNQRTDKLVIISVVSASLSLRIFSTRLTLTSSYIAWRNWLVENLGSNDPSYGMLGRISWHKVSTRPNIMNNQRRQSPSHPSLFGN